MNCYGLSLMLVVQMANNSNMDICIKCKTKTTHIFHDSGGLLFGMLAALYSS
jgi:hypothetical protein